MKKKLEKLASVYDEHGLSGALLFCVNFLIAKTGWFHDKWILGRIVEMRGDTVRINGCRFRTNSPLFTTAFKSRFLLGRYEKKERQAVRNFLNPKFPVIELGGSVGVVACITNKKLVDPKKHIVVEANPALIPLLEVNRTLNTASFEIVNKAYGYGQTEMTFYVHERFSSSGTERVTDKPITVPTITLENIFMEYKFEYANLICDIEGSEVTLVDNELDLLSKKVFQIILEVHPSIVGPETVRRILGQIEAAGFQKVQSGVDPYGEVWVFENSSIKDQIA